MARGQDMFDGMKQKMNAKSAAMLVSIEGGIDRMVIGWLVVAALASAARVATSPLNGPLDAGELLPYMMLVFGPAASMVLALRWFAEGDRLPQPEIRLAKVGRWRELGRAEAARHPLFGPRGLMVSLLVGMLLNVPVRAAEYLAGMPALSGDVPRWLSTLHLMMTVDVVLLTSLYTIAFVAALRRVPFFPRLLGAIWMADLSMQLAIAKLSVAAGLPTGVASDLHVLLDGNVKKVFISVGLWLPYLLMSARVNVTYRHRAPA